MSGNQEMPFKGTAKDGVLHSFSDGGLCVLAGSFALLTSEGWCNVLHLRIGKREQAR